ncbi:Uncharacterized HTH-type transcriptional regulator yurK [Pantoea agglomerans]|uniref:Uncharacterized HTH-type transcriptional regulator yurK n=1 Tax=Enterobacter agglomerans TaxID=549 RepID=A0A379AJH9_ENTAG|nr:Uncharacterized HTH-type transcriptional regulator yurK [Pantoea agglomerans]
MVEHTALAQLAAAMSDEPAPIYQRVKQAIVSQIREGLWKANQRVPSESELVNELGVSRMTINRALRELTSEGFLVRMQGVGTFVAEMKGYTAMLEVHNIADEIAPARPSAQLQNPRHRSGQSRSRAGGGAGTDYRADALSFADCALRK